MICSVILGGGSGTRLWPLSDSKTPKQFLKLFSDKSMIVETSERIRPIVPLERQFVLTGKSFSRLVEEQFEGKINIMTEPMAKNTAPCILWAAMKIQKQYGPNAVMAVLPSDHIIKEEKFFLEAFRVAEKSAQDGFIVTFGILPDRPETGFGYIEIENGKHKANQTVERIVAFHEKPNAEKAKSFLADGNFLWNSGMFVFRVDVIIGEFSRYCGKVYNSFEGVDPDDENAVKIAFDNVPSISIDYAVMEHTHLGCCIPSDFGWSDVGSYLSLHEAHDKDADGNVTVGNVLMQNTTNSYINGKKRIVCIGMEDIVVVEGEDTILVAKKGDAAAVGEIAKRYKSEE